jgi:hypothetical protein
MALYGVLEHRSQGSLCGIALLTALLCVVPGADVSEVAQRVVIAWDDVVAVGRLVEAAPAVLLDDLASTAGAVPDDSPE